MPHSVPDLDLDPYSLNVPHDIQQLVSKTYLDIHSSSISKRFMAVQMLPVKYVHPSSFPLSTSGSASRKIIPLSLHPWPISITTSFSIPDTLCFSPSHDFTQSFIKLSSDTPIIPTSTAIPKNVAHKASVYAFKQINNIHDHEPNQSQPAFLEFRVITAPADINSATASNVVLEVWDSDPILRARAKLNDMFKDVYTSGVFGDPCFTPDQQWVAFIAEKQEPKFGNSLWEPFQEMKVYQKDVLNDQSGETDQAVSTREQKNNATPPAPAPPVDKFAFRPNFGEKMYTIVRPSVVLWNWVKNEFIDLSKFLRQSHPQIYFSSPSFIWGGLLLLGYNRPHKYFQPGLSVCFNRSISLYFVKGWDSSSPTITNITQSLYLALSPIIPQDQSKMFVVGRKEPFITHCTALELFVMNKDFKIISVGIYPGSADDSNVLNHALSKACPNFTGIYAVLHEDIRNFKCLDDGKTIIINTMSRGYNAVYLINTERLDLSLQVLPPMTSSISPSSSLSDNSHQQNDTEMSCSVTCMSAYGNTFVVATESFTFPQTLWLCRWDPDSNEIHYQFITAAANKSLIPSYIKETKIHSINTEHSGSQAWLLIPNISEKSSTNCASQNLPSPRPLISRLHGGPHVAAINAFIPELCAFLAMGFPIVMPNYRGSAGFGKDYLECLIGKAGDIDVRDCYDATLQAKEILGKKDNPNRKVFAYGGSHGGFLAGWLLGHPQYKQLFDAGVLWNPAVDFHSMMAATDIPEWILCEAAGRDDSVMFPLDRDLEYAAWKASPMSVAHNVSVPALVVWGTADLRVPYHGGLRWAQAVSKSANVKVDVLSFPGQNHSIADPEQSQLVRTVIAMWLEKQSQ